MTIYTDQKLSRNSRKTHKWLRASRNLCTFASETYIYILYRPENQKLMKKLYWLRASRNCWYFGVWNQTRNQKLYIEKNPEMIASEPKCSYFRVGFFFFYHRPENQKIKKKLYSLYQKKWYSQEKNYLGMIFVENVCVFGIILKLNNSSFFCFLNHIIYFCKSRVMLLLVRQDKIPFVPLFVFIEINRHECFNNKTINLWGQRWKKLLKHLLIWYLLLSSTRINTQTRTQSCTHTNTHTRAHTLILYLCHTLTLACVCGCMYVCVCLYVCT